MCNKFQIDWTSTSPTTTLTKKFNLKRDSRTNDGRTDERTNGQSEKQNANKWIIKQIKQTTTNKQQTTTNDNH